MVTVRHDLTDPSSGAGMVRISDGSDHRFIWPVHLSGWESMGWQLVVGATGSGAGTTGPAVVEPVEIEQLTEQLTEQVVAPKSATTKTTKTRASKSVVSEPGAVASVPVAPVDSGPLVLDPGAEGGSELADDLLI